jgi:hypothetical protein
MGHRGLVLRPRRIGTGRTGSQIPFIHSMFVIFSMINFHCDSVVMDFSVWDIIK